tara:strand:+ start:183 stop:1187 length:1005 start_codon:yes stop_codon:yes gene_type:complete
MLSKNFKIGSKEIGVENDPYVIAEIGSNYNQNIETANALIDVAQDAGASAVKFQLFCADELYDKSHKLHSVFKKNELSHDHAILIQQYCKHKKIDFLCSCFDMTSFNFLEDIGIVAHKVASSEVTNLKLLSRIFRTKKPVLLSTGMCELSDISSAIELARDLESNKLCIMQCGSQYPLHPKNANLKFIRKLSDYFDTPVGFSDHSISNVQSLVALGLGARVFEKHITLDKSQNGPDHFYSLEPVELKNYIAQIDEAYISLGDGQKKLLDSEKKEGRRYGLYFANALKAGDIIKDSDLIHDRPRLEVNVKFKDIIIGKELIEDVSAGDPVSAIYL